MSKTGYESHITTLAHGLAGSVATGGYSSAHLQVVSSALQEWKSDFTILIPVLARHGLTGATYTLLERQEFSRIDAAQILKGLLQRPFVEETALTLAHLRTLERARNVLEPEGIDLIITQGAALMAHRIYPRVDMRPMADVDTIVLDGQWEEAVTILASAGFQAGSTESQWIDGAGVLDLHPSPLGMDRITGRSLAMPLTTALVREHSGALPHGSLIEGNLLVPTLPMLWAMGLAHAQKHSFNALMWLVDLARIAEAMSADERLEARSISEQLRLEGAGAVVSGVVRSCWDLPLPPALEFDSEILDKKMKELVERAVSEITRLVDPIPLGERMLWRMVPGRVDRLRLMAESAFPRGSVMREIYADYSPWLRPWFILRRSWDLGQQYFRNR